MARADRLERLSLPAKLRIIGGSLSLDAKRKPSEVKGIESWYPYYAGYTEDFARGVLQQLSADAPLTVLDPWNGSGTTTRVAHEMGHHAIGFDLNPVASLVASAKIVHPADALHVSGLARRMATACPSEIDSFDSLLPWLAPSVVSQFRSIQGRILGELATSSGGNTISPASGSLPPLAAFMMLALIRVAREVASIHQGTNPTWTTPGEGRRRAIRTLGRRWETKVKEMACDLDLSQAEGRPWFGKISTADARCLPLPDSNVDLVLTSPPYCTRIDYVVNSSFELAALGIGGRTQEFEDLRRASMGTPLTRKGPLPGIPPTWPNSVHNLLTAIRTHPSKASASYYYKTFHQYFADARTSLVELHRVLKPGGLALFVVQTSYYKNLSVDLPSLYIDLAKDLGFSGALLGEAPVHRSIAQIHRHTAQHRKESLYKEAVITLEKTS